MERLDLDSAMRSIAIKHHVNLAAIDFNQVIANRDERQEEEAERFTIMNQNTKRRRLFDSSVISDKEDLQQTFDDFDITDDNQNRELLEAKKIAYRIIQGVTGNFTFSGNAGAGKTMLAISVLNQIMKSNDVLTCYFASFSMLVQMSKDSFTDEGIKRDLSKAEKCIQNCDVLVLDDLGSESAMKSDDRYNEASNYTQALLFRIADYRKSKTNIVTTNNTSKEIQRIYNNKIYSRLIAKKKENAIIFDSRDMRNLF